MSSGISDPIAMGQASLQSGNFAEAISNFEEALRANPNNTTVKKNLAIAYVSSQNFDGALPHAQAAAALLPQDPETRYVLGFIFATTNRFEQAIPELDACLAFNPNHIPARQALIHSLIGDANTKLSEDWRVPEALLDRARKLDRENVMPVLGLLKLYYEGQQKQKVIALMDELSPGLKANQEMVKWADKLKADPSYATSLRHAAVAQQVAGPAKPIAAPQQKQIPCPMCKRPIMEWAAICPHCGHQNRAVGQFAGRAQNIPKATWQEGAYLVIAILWTLSAVWSFVSVFALGMEDLSSPFSKFFITLAGANVLVGFGLIFKVEWVMFLAKILCYINILSYLPNAFILLGLGKMVPGLLNLVGLGLTCFMIYLINYNE